MLKFKKSLFELAEDRLIQEKKEGKIPCYTMADIIDYAIEIRKFLDTNKGIRKFTKLTAKEMVLNHRKAQKRYILKKRG
jgi:hypothetical protein